MAAVSRFQRAGTTETSFDTGFARIPASEDTLARAGLERLVERAAFRPLDGVVNIGGREIPGLGDPGVIITLPQTDQQKRAWDSALAPAYKWTYPGDPEPAINQKLNDLEADLTRRRDQYLKSLNEAKDPKMQAFYRDLFAAMVLDLNDLATARTLPTSYERGVALNRIALEAHIEVRYNVNLLNASDKPWTEDELKGIERGLSKVPHKHTVEGDTLSIIRKTPPGIVNGVEASGVHFGDGEITIADPGSAAFAASSFDEILIHELGHSQEPKGALFDEFKKISGWKRIGDQDDARLAELSTRDWITAGELRRRGFEVEGDDNQHFQISKSQGSIFVVPSPAPPEESDKFVSPYSRRDPQEDFAESYAFFFLHPAEMEKKFPEKFAFFKQHFSA